MMRNFIRLLSVASAAFFIASSALAQGTVTNHAFVIGKGAGVTGYTSLLCGSAQLAVGQSAADPICRTITGDVTITAAGVTAIGSAKVLGAMLGAMTSAELRAALSDETGTGIAYFVGGALGTPSSATLTNATGLPVAGIAAQAAYTFIGNNSGSSAVPTAVDIAALTTKASPAAGDYVMLSDQAASGAWKKASVASVASAGSVSSIAGNTGTFTLDGGITNSTNAIRLGQYYCIVNLSADQNLTTTTKTKINFNTEVADPMGWYDNATNYRFTPLVAGVYQVTVTILADAASGMSGNQFAMIYKNGSEVVENIQPASSSITITATHLISMNGSTDYIEGWARVTATGTPRVLGGTAPVFTYMSIRYVGP